VSCHCSRRVNTISSACSKISPPIAHFAAKLIVEAQEGWIFRKKNERTEGGGQRWLATFLHTGISRAVCLFFVAGVGGKQFVKNAPAAKVYNLNLSGLRRKIIAGVSPQFVGKWVSISNFHFCPSLDNLNDEFQQWNQHEKSLW
jgi:hypothetical protein